MSAAPTRPGLGQKVGATTVAVLLTVVVGHDLAAAQNEDRILRIERRIVPFDGATVREAEDVSTISIDSDVLFEFGSAELTEPSIATIDAIAEDLSGQTLEGSVVVTGHTDNVGDNAFNIDLSIRRAEAVGARLAEAGLTVISDGRGESEPVAPNDTEAGRRRNRRVEISYESVGESDR